MVGAEIKFIGTMMLDLQFASSANNCSFYSGGNSGETANFDLLRFKTSSYDTAALTQPVTLFTVSSYQGTDVTSSIQVKNLYIEDDVGGLAKYYVLDANTTAVPFINGTMVEDYVYDNLRPRTSRLRLIITAGYTHYGQHAESVLFVPASLSAATTITLSNKFKASGTGNTQPTPTGTVVRVRRQSGTYANALTVTDAASGNALTTNTASGADYLYIFGGTNWTAFT